MVEFDTSFTAGEKLLSASLDLLQASREILRSSVLYSKRSTRSLVQPLPYCKGY